MTSMASSPQPAAWTSNQLHSIPMLGASGNNLAEWLREVYIYADTNHGKVGQDIRHKLTTPLLNPNPGPLTSPPPTPNYFSPRIHPRTNQPIPDSRLYDRRELTESEAILLNLALEAETDEEALDIFDLDAIELTKEAQSQLLRDQDNHRRTADKLLHNHTTATLAFNTEFDGRKKQDDSFLNTISSTLHKVVKDTIKSNPLYTAHSTLQSYARTQSFINIIVEQYGIGNATTTVSEISKFFSMSQTKPTSTGEFYTHVADVWARVRPLLESKEHPGYSKLDAFYSLVLIKGLDKHQSANRRALELHVDKYAKDVLNHPTELIQAVLAMQTSDLATISDTLDSEASAFISTTKTHVSTSKKTSNLKLPPKVRHDGTVDGSKIASRDDHCSNCFKLVNLYYYHKLENCKRKPKIGAHSAVLSDPTPTNSTSLELASYRSEALAAHNELAAYRSEALAAHNAAEALELAEYRADAAYRLSSQDPHAFVAHTSSSPEDRARHAAILADQLLQAGFVYPNV